MQPLPVIYPISGGLLIGAAAALLLILSGRIAGVSGMVAAATRISDKGPPWTQATAFVFGLPLGAWLMAIFYRGPEIVISSSIPLLVAAGLLVGFGTRLGNGCTSGHGVCGVARLSGRSIAATATFMVTAIVTVFVVRHLLGA